MTLDNSSTKTTTPLFSNSTYDYVRYAVQYILPGAGALYFTLAQIWGLPYGEQVVGSLAAVTIFLGIILGFSNRSYIASGSKYDGALVVDTSNPVKDTYSLDVTTPFDDLNSKQELVLKVENANSHSSQ